MEFPRRQPSCASTRNARNLSQTRCGYAGRQLQLINVRQADILVKKPRSFPGTLFYWTFLTY
jgi:hypothetical protein